MIWIILTFVFGWLLCGAWAMRMWEKYVNCVEDDWGLFYSLGLVALIIGWFFIWPERIWTFCKDFVIAFKQALKGKDANGKED